MVMLYSMKKNIPNFLEHSHKIFYNDVFCKLSDENKEKIRKIIPNMQFDNIQQPSYDTPNIVFYHGRPPLLTLEAFRQSEYDIVCKFDNDMLCVDDITDVLYVDGDLVGCGVGETMNCGFFVVNDKILKATPNHYYSGMIKMIDSWKNGPAERMNDQTAINKSGVFQNDSIVWNHPSDDYNVRGQAYGLLDYTGKNGKTRPTAKILHWSGYMHSLAVTGKNPLSKPWDENPVGCHAQTLWEKYRDEMYEELR